MNLKSYTVTELYIYPVKSLAGIPVETALAQEMGFENDRRWMLIDNENQFITQRNHPVLTQFFPKINESSIEISYLDKKHEFSISESSDIPIFSKVWDDETTVFEVNGTTSKWFSEILGFGCKLVKIGDRIHTSTQLNKSLNVSLADGYPYLLMGSKSFDFLNEKLKKKITIQRFRPNIVIRTTVAHEEDSLTLFQIGAVKFQNAKPCSRCIMINNNPENGIVYKEPLRSLSKYRKVDNLVFFGTNLICLNEGEINVGDSLVF
ncbi:MOSC domain-containing protein [Flavobacterium sp.]|uniref:MOSC domain-containing protein n=1 Tax=Flavobacterium sp. TaxID=239 RepID=UPI0038FC51A1